MKKFVNTIIEKAKAALAHLKGLIRKSNAQTAEEAPEAEPSAVKKAATVAGMCTLVGVVAFFTARLVTDLKVVIHGVCMWAGGLSCLLGLMTWDVHNEFSNVVCAHEWPFEYKLICAAFVALIAVGAYICSIFKSAINDSCKVSDCTRNDLNRVVNRCKNHPYKVLWFVLAALTCVPAVWRVPQDTWRKTVYAIASNYGRVAGASFALCSNIVEAIMLIAALTCVRM